MQSVCVCVLCMYMCYWSMLIYTSMFSACNIGAGVIDDMLECMAFQTQKSRSRSLLTLASQVCGYEQIGVSWVLVPAPALALRTERGAAVAILHVRGGDRRGHFALLGLKEKTKQKQNRQQQPAASHVLTGCANVQTGLPMQTRKERKNADNNRPVRMC